MPIDLKHPVFSRPTPQAKLWRYMEFAKFVALVTSNGMWFTNADTLAQDDPFEGSLPKSHFVHRTWHTLADMAPRDREELEAQRHDLTADAMLKKMCADRDSQISAVAKMRKSYFLNCWHAAATESAAMWKAYAKHDHGIAITSNLDRMVRAFGGTPENIYLGRISYVDFDTATVDISNIFHAILTKRLSFSSENEYRLVHWDNDIAHVKASDGLMRVRTPEEMAALPVPVGRAIACVLDDLIEEIWISPTAPAWVFDAVASVCNLVGLKGKLIRSNLLDQPPK